MARRDLSPKAVPGRRTEGPAGTPDSPLEHDG